MVVSCAWEFCFLVATGLFLFSWGSWVTSYHTGKNALCHCQRSIPDFLDQLSQWLYPYNATTLSSVHGLVWLHSLLMKNLAEGDLMLWFSFPCTFALLPVCRSHEQNQELHVVALYGYSHWLNWSRKSWMDFWQWHENLFLYGLM